VNEAYCCFPHSFQENTVTISIITLRLFSLTTSSIRYSLSFNTLTLYRMSQEGKSIFWEVIVSAIVSKTVYTYMYLIPNGFRDRAIWLYGSKIVDRKEILHTVSNSGIYVQVAKLVQFTYTFPKIPPSTSMHSVTGVRTWRVAQLYNVLYREITLSRKPFGIGHMHIYTFLLRMTDTMTSQNIDLSSWDILYIPSYRRRFKYT
jgi:hypothetical protein